MWCLSSKSLACLGKLNMGICDEEAKVSHSFYDLPFNCVDVIESRVDLVQVSLTLHDWSLASRALPVLDRESTFSLVLIHVII